MRYPATLPTVTFTVGQILQAAGVFRVLLAPIDVASDDRRVIVGDLGWRDPPLPFMASDSEMGHGDAVHVGNLDNFRKESIDGVDWVVADLSYDSDETAREFERLAAEGKFNGVSIHMGKGDFWPVRQMDGAWHKLTAEELDALIGPVEVEIVTQETVPEDPWANIYDGCFGAEIAAATQVAIPAFPGSRIEAETLIQAAVSGSTDLPVAGRDREWDGPAASSAQFGDDENPDFTRARRGHLFVREEGDKKGDFVLPFADVIDGTLTIVPRGVFASAGGRGVDAVADISDEDREAVKKRICTLYGRVREEGEDLPCPFESMQAANLYRPSRAWFQDPNFGTNGDEDPRLVWDERHQQWGCPGTLTADGQYFGHLALWKSCHTGFGTACVHPPRNPDFTRFHSLSVITDDGVRVPVGPVVVDEGHVPASWSLSRKQQHYGSTALCAGYGAAGVDQHGVWIAGAGSHKATAAQLETLRRHPLSGDWDRTAGKEFELIVAVCVNAPGYVVPQSLVAATGENSMVTFGPFVEVKSDLRLVTDAIERLYHLLASGIPQGPVVEDTVTADRVVAEFDELLLAAEIGALTIR